MSTPPPEPVAEIARAFPLHTDPEAARSVTADVRAALLEAAPHLASGDLAHATEDDLARLFALYDERCFRGHLARRLAALGCGAPRLRFSRRLTSAAGKTTRYSWRDPADPSARLTAYEIAISAPLLLDSFRGEVREVRVVGLPCRDRLDALCRVFEHELVHLLESLAFGDTSCRGPRFLYFASRLFGHTGTGHALVTRRERAFEEFGLRVGDRVGFEHEGELLLGTLVRITRRATVRVTDGPLLGTWYVPIPKLVRC